MDPEQQSARLERAKEMKARVLALRAERNDPSTSVLRRRRLKLQIETLIWCGQRLDPDLFKTYRRRA